MMARKAAPRGVMLGLGAVALSVSACNAILGIDSSTYVPKADAAIKEAAAPDAESAHEASAHSSDDGPDAVHDARGDSTVDAGLDAARDATLDVMHDATLDATFDVALDARPDSMDAADASHRNSDADADTDASVSMCPPADATPEGGKAPDPGLVECNSTLPKDDGGTCRLDAGQFCCNPAADAAGVAGGSCESSKNFSVEGACFLKNSPAGCDEAADCPANSDCCLILNLSTVANGVPQTEQGCFAYDGGNHCVIPASASYVETLSVHICKINGECGPCGQCQVYCCAGRQIEACDNPSEAAGCKVGLCTPTFTDSFQNDSETDIDCGGLYRTDASRNDASDKAPACGAGHKCNIGRDCVSQMCGADDAGVKRCQ